MPPSKHDGSIVVPASHGFSKGFYAMDPDADEEHIVMTPKGKTATSTIILVERLKAGKRVAPDGAAHVGGGEHRGIVVNKECKNGIDIAAPQLQLEFKVFLLNAKTETHSQESRMLRFWFKSFVVDKDQTRTAQDFFKELVAPMEFPRDYVGFIKKIMKMMQNKYKTIAKTEIELRQLEDMDQLPQRPSEEPAKVLDEDKVLESIESAYPNPIAVKDLAKTWSCSEESVELLIQPLCDRGLVKPMGKGCYTRVVQNETDVMVVRQMPTISSQQQPTIAIITAQYCEKLAVDAMIENQETFVRYTTVGESNVYTLGNIGAHRVVCTKLPQVGHDRSAAIAAGNTTTRLLGTFQKVEHVFLVGVGGGVPHFTDCARHVRLGDIVVSSPPEGEKYIYMYCDSVRDLKEGGCEFDTKSWGPPNLALQDIAFKLKEQALEMTTKSPFMNYCESAMEKLHTQEMDFVRPSADTDKLYMGIGGEDMIEVSHPAPPEGVPNIRDPTTPFIHLGAIASGRCISRQDQQRQALANQLCVMAFDQEMDPVLESIYGNRKDNYVVVRGICDYKDGSRGREWQPYASLAAAAFTKSMICAMDPPPED